MSDQEIKDRLEKIFDECEDPYEGGHYINEAIDMILELVKSIIHEQEIRK